MEVKQALGTSSVKVVKHFPMCLKQVETSNVASCYALCDPTVLLMEKSYSFLLFPPLPHVPSEDYGPAAILLHFVDYAAEGWGRQLIDLIQNNPSPVHNTCTHCVAKPAPAQGRSQDCVTEVSGRQQETTSVCLGTVLRIASQVQRTRSSPWLYVLRSYMSLELL